MCTLYMLTVYCYAIKLKKKQVQIKLEKKISYT